MTVLFMDGFDAYNGTATGNTGATMYWTLSGSAANVPITTGRYGGQAIQGTIYLPDYVYNTHTAASSFNCGHSFYQATLALPVATVNPYISFSSDATPQVGLKVNTGGSISACRLTGLNNGTVLGTSANNVIKAATWHTIEFACTISDTVGTVDVRVDGVNVLSLTNQDTRNGTPTTVNRIYIGGCNGLYNTPYKIDDLYVTDSLTFIGPMRIETLYPTADTSQKQFSASTGNSNYAMVDEAQMNDTDWVAANTVSNYDLYDFGNLSSIPSGVSAIALSALVRKSDVLSRSVAIVSKSGVTTTEHTNTSLSLAYTYVNKLLETDPGTSGPWTGVSVNALQVGPKVTQ